MPRKITPLIIGLVTSLLMGGVLYWIYDSKKDINYQLQYLIYIIFGLGIAASLLVYYKSPSFTGKFGDLFLSGFRCFVIVTLVMVAMTAFLTNRHPEYREEAAVSQREYMVQARDNTPAEIDEAINTFKKQYMSRQVSAAIFRYLISGALITAIVSALLTRRR
jgi:hypothetical protein